jgi:transcription initiation factor TFIIB
MDNYLNRLNGYSYKQEESDLPDNNCCDIMDNHSICQEKILCRICGQNIENISFSPEKCYDNKMQSNHGMPVSVLLPDTNLGSVVGGKYYKTHNMRIVQQMNNYTSMSYKDRSVLNVFNHISECCKRHDINDKIIDEAKGIYKHISCKKISRGSNRKGIIAACVFMAAKNVGNPRSSKEISKIFDVTSPVITKGIKNVNEILRVHKLENRVISYRVDSTDLISRFCNNLNFSEEDIKSIMNMSLYLLKTYSKELSSCTPPSLSASFIYYYIYKNNINISKKNISQNTDISIVTIQKIVNIILNLDGQKKCD